MIPKKILVKYWEKLYPIAINNTLQNLQQIKNNPDVMYYQYIPPSLEDHRLHLNGVYSRIMEGKEEELCCQHLSWFFLAEGDKKGKIAGMQQALIKRPHSFVTVSSGDKAIQNAKSSEVAYISSIPLLLLDYFPEKIGDEIKALFISENHAMGIILKRKRDKLGREIYVMKFFEGQNNTYVRTVFTNQDAIKSSINKCFYQALRETSGEDKVQLYFPKNKCGALIILSNELLQFSGSPAFKAVRSETSVSAANPPAYFRDEEKAKYWSDVLYFALKLNYHTLLPKAIEQIQSHCHDACSLTELLAAKDDDGTPGLFMALQNGHHEAVAAFCEAILKSNLDAAQKIELLTAKDEDGIPGLYTALCYGYGECYDTVVAFCATILNSTLDVPQKIELLAAKSADGTPGLFMALQNGHHEAVAAFCATILNSTLDAPQKIELLAAKRKDGTPGLYMALQTGHHEAVAKFCSAVVYAQGLTPEEKAKIFARSCMTGASKALWVFCAALFRSKDLTGKQKIDFLIAQNINGKPGLLLNATINTLDEVNAKCLIDTITALEKSDGCLSKSTLEAIMSLCCDDTLNPDTIKALMPAMAVSLKLY